MGGLEAELAEAPGSDVYADVYSDAVGAVRQWRRRYRGNQALWRRLMRPEKLVKEIVESAPVISAVCDYVESADGPVTVVTGKKRRLTIVECEVGRARMCV